MTQHVRGDAFLVQRGACRPCNGQVLGEQVVESVVTEKAAALIREDGGVRFAAKFLQPVPQRCRRVLAQRRTAFLASLAMATHMGTGAELDIPAAQTEEFRRSQSGLHRYKQQGAVTASRPRPQVRGSQQGLDFVPVEKIHRTAGMALVRHGQDPLRQGRVLGLVRAT